MGEDAQDHLALLGECSARGQRGAEPTFVPAEGTLCVPALMIQRLREALAHFPAVGGAWPSPSHIAWVQLDHGSAHAELFSAEPMVVLGVVTRVCQRGLDREQRCRLSHRGRKRGRVLRGTGPGHRAQDEVRLGMYDRREFLPSPSGSVLTFRFPTADAVIEAGVTSFESGGVHCRYRRGSDQPCTRGASENRMLNLEKGPPFSAPRRSRCSA